MPTLNTCTHACTHAHMHTHTSTYTHTNTCTQTHAHACTHAHKAHTCTHAPKHAHVHTFVRTHTHPRAQDTHLVVCKTIQVHTQQATPNVTWKRGMSVLTIHVGQKRYTLSERDMMAGTTAAVGNTTCNAINTRRSQLVPPQNGPITLSLSAVAVPQVNCQAHCRR